MIAGGSGYEVGGPGVRSQGPEARVRVKVAPGAREDAVMGWQGEVLRLRVRAAPEAGKANEAVCRLIAASLDVPASSVSIARGGSSRDKLIRVEGLDDSQIRARLAGGR